MIKYPLYFITKSLDTYEIVRFIDFLTCECLGLEIQRIGGDRNKWLQFTNKENAIRVIRRLFPTIKYTICDSHEEEKKLMVKIKYKIK